MFCWFGCFGLGVSVCMVWGCLRFWVSGRVWLSVLCLFVWFYIGFGGCCCLGHVALGVFVILLVGCVGVCVVLS